MEDKTLACTHSLYSSYILTMNKTKGTLTFCICNSVLEDPATKMREQHIIFCACIFYIAIAQH